MTGYVDNSGRALLRITLQHSISRAETDFDAWIDTGFTGELVLSQQQIAAMGLPLGPVITAALADGSIVQLNTYTCLLDWFGTWKRIEVIANQGQFPLLGIGLLVDHDLRIDYLHKTLVLT